MFYQLLTLLMIKICKYKIFKNILNSFVNLMFDKRGNVICYALKDICSHI